MKFRPIALLLCLLLLSGCAAAPETTHSTQMTQDTIVSAPSVTQSTPAPTQAPDLHEAVYLGVDNYGQLSKEEKADFTHLFFRDGGILSLKIQADSAFLLQNQLMEGYLYLLDVQGDTLVGLEPVTPVPATLPKGQTLYAITTAPGGAQVTITQAEAGTAVHAVGKHFYLLPDFSPYAPPVSGTPGLRTVRNLLATAMMPVGSTLYVYGGGWNWQDDAASLQAATIGLPQSWLRFFQSQAAAYDYEDYFPQGGWNQYYYAGADCSGYLGWAIYNTLHNTDHLTGYVGPSTQMAASLAQRGLGNLVSEPLRPGDILSMKGHVYMVVGTCDDGSAVILHSTPNTTSGAGVQLSAIGNSKACQAWLLADHYMNTYFPQWAARYGSQVLCLSPAAYAPTAHFRWDSLSDPEGLQNMDAGQVLEVLFGA